MGKRGTSAGQTESAKVQDEAERQDNPERSEREKEKSPLRSLSGARRTEVLSSPERRRRTGELCTGGRRAERDNGEHADGRTEGRPEETTTCPERGTSAGQVVVSGGSGSVRAECGRAYRSEATRRAGFSHMRGSRCVAFQTFPLLRLTISGTRQRAIRRVRWTV